MLAPHLIDSLHAEGRLAAHGTTKTTLDLPLQRDVEGLVRTHVASIRAFGASDAAVLVVDNASGDVLAYVGGASYEDPVAGKVDMARAHRQPGSTLKPFVYALAFERGHGSSDMIADVPTAFPSETGTYSPGNFDGTFEGPISLREALAGSLNVPAIRLAAELPHGALLERLHALGFALPEDERHYGLSLALGSGEVTLRELAAAYATLARGGARGPARDRGGGSARDAMRRGRARSSTPPPRRSWQTRSPTRSRACAGSTGAGPSTSAFRSRPRPAPARAIATRGPRASPTSARSPCGSATPTAPRCAASRARGARGRSSPT